MRPNHKKAVLVFSADLQNDLADRGLSKKFSELLRINSLSSKVTTQADIHVFTTGHNFASRFKITDQLHISIHAQKGSCFRERLLNAIDTLADLAYGQIVVIGSDCPELESHDIHVAFEKLSTHSLVIGPDHRGGCYLIGFHTSNANKLREIQWQADTDCIQLQQIFGKQNTFLLPVKHDIDSMEDVRLLANCKNKWGAKARRLLQQQSNLYPDDLTSSIHLPIDIERSYWQLPPPYHFSFSTQS